MWTTITLLATALATSPVQDRDLFATLDRNGDGVVTAAEITEGQRTHFERALRIADQNADGALSSSELQAALTGRKAIAVPMPQRGPGNRPGAGANINPQQLDRNKDGLLSADEVPQGMRARYQQALDKFGQPALPLAMVQQLLRGGRPTEEQINKARAEMMKRDGGKSAVGAGQRERTENSRRPNRSGQSSGEDRDAGAIFSRLDRNGDGKLSTNELPDRLKRFEQRIDTNGDGSISRAEFKQSARNRMQRQPNN
jgi:Ca2+-binding EF-hand superfamily protein